MPRSRAIITSSSKTLWQTPEMSIDLDLAVPVHNEEHVLERSVQQLRDHLDGWPEWRITIVDNASTDGTWAVAKRLAAELPGVEAQHVDRMGRGLALRTAWSRSNAGIVAYTDVDLSTGLDALGELVAPLRSGQCDIAIGSRLAPESAVVRGARRELISRCYNGLLHAVLRTQFRDAQCGFKALRADVARVLLPHVISNEWFFDTELLLLAQRNGLRIHEVPVDWVDDPDSRVRIMRTAMEDLRGLARMRIEFWRNAGYVAGLPPANSRYPARPP
jgi:glycosyltransferase involved in cell wall biosynthesis